MLGPLTFWLMPTQAPHHTTPLSQPHSVGALSINIESRYYFRSPKSGSPEPVESKFFFTLKPFALEPYEIERLDARFFNIFFYDSDNRPECFIENFQMTLINPLNHVFTKSRPKICILLLFYNFFKDFYKFSQFSNFEQLKQVQSILI